MKKMYVLLVLFFCVSVQTSVIYVDFDTSMQTNLYKDVINSDDMLRRVGISGLQLMDFFKSLYNKHNFLTAKPSVAPKIPKIIHQIWIGASVPEKFRELQKTWLDQHPDWEYRLWTQDDIPSFGFYNVDLIAQSRNPGEISDMMRYEILYRMGGVYVDFDFESLCSLDVLHHLYDFYIGIQPLDSGLVQLGIGLIGSVPGHPILQYAIEQMRLSWGQPENRGDPPQRTGPIFFTRAFFAMAGRGNSVDIALPAHYLYPLGCTDYKLQYDEWKKQGAFGVHHWASSWLRPEFRRQRFKELN